MHDKLSIISNHFLVLFLARISLAYNLKLALSADHADPHRLHH